MYQHFGSELVNAVSDTADVNAYAALTSDGKLTVLIINLSPEAKSLPIQLVGDWQLTETWLFDSTHSAEQIESPSFTNGNPIDLPAQSITLFVFSGS
jgi:hypothetical protein